LLGTVKYLGLIIVVSLAEKIVQRRMAEDNVPTENVAMHLTVSSTYVANSGAVYLTSEPMNPA